ncbi:hypothetical protein CLV63_111104 [Murinocardiopsis flavida]|uniref:N-acetyltransferase domain-containing protein n=1 Tax=Murinocardiopsis flavida TaxID=645275 RepID=A0A2P8DH56_9ACTN|nr:hypothetical protein [Murinocardiopsis flavida]PSK96509.1 hypothetical protein CLV63_111104 [Murinocardiopsis flavida]
MTVDTRLDVRDALAFDIDAISELAYRHRMANRDPHSAPITADDLHRQRIHLQQSIGEPRVLSLVGTRAGYLSGYLFASLVESRQSEAAGTLFSYIEDFAVSDPGDWWDCGASLLESARVRLRALGVRRLVVINDGPDARMRAFLWRSGLTQASEWYGTDRV